MRILLLLVALLFTACQKSPSVVQDSKLSLYKAVRKGELNLVKNIVESDSSINLNHAENKKFPILHLAAAWKKAKVLKYLISKGAKVDIETFNGFYPIHLAAESACIECMKVLIENGADVNRENKKNKVFPLASVIPSKNIEAIKFLLDNGAKVDVAKGMMISPLSMAVRGQSLDIVKLLMEKGNAKDINGAMYFVTMYNRLDIAKYLLSRASMDINNADGINLMENASEEMRELFIKYGAKAQ